MKSVINIALIQMSHEKDPALTYSKALERIREAAKLGANIVCTQELFKSHYFCQVADSRNFDLAEAVEPSSPTLQQLAALAGQLEIVLIASLFEKQAPGIYFNTTVVLDADGRYLGKYRKMHIPEDPYYYEKFYFTPGDLGYQVFKSRYGKLGVLICWDQWFPEAARLTALKGAEIIFYPTAIGYMPIDLEQEDYRTFEAWQTVQRGHAVANGCFIAAVNRVGFEENPDGQGGLQFWGGSFLADPYGTVLQQAPQDQESIVLCAVDLSEIDQVRNALAHFYRDRRIESYRDLTRRYIPQNADEQDWKR